MTDDDGRGPASERVLASVVIPVLHDAEELTRLLGRLGAGRPDRSGVEVIVANGDPDDTSLPPLRARFPAVRWVASARGRARQMNTAARQGTGRWLLFLHADSDPDPRWLDVIRAVDPEVDIVGGAFRFELRSPRRAARLIEAGVRGRVRWLGLPYGDQGIFVRRTVFEAIGGFADLPIMEDVDLVRRVRRRGRLHMAAVPIGVSARRWERRGWARQTLLNVALLGLYEAGVSPMRLARMYYGSTAEPFPTTTPVPADRDVLKLGAHRVGVVMPALDEAAAIGQVLDDIPQFVTQVTVVDNGSADATAELARGRGATVVDVPVRGYGRACRAGVEATADCDLLVFLDADRSDFPHEMATLVSPIVEGHADLVLGVRDGSHRPVAARLGTAVCVGLINQVWGTRYRDLGPFRAIRRAALEQLGMTDQTWGWTIEMQVRAVEVGLRVVEVPIRQRPRVGRSKISGTIPGTVRAGGRMLTTILTLWRTRRDRHPGHA